MLKKSNKKILEKNVELSFLWSLIHRGKPTIVHVCKALKFGPLSLRSDKVREG